MKQKKATILLTAGLILAPVAASPFASLAPFEKTVEAAPNDASKKNQKKKPVKKQPSDLSAFAQQFEEKVYKKSNKNVNSKAFATIEKITESTLNKNLHKNKGKILNKKEFVEVERIDQEIEKHGIILSEDLEIEQYIKVPETNISKIPGTVNEVYNFSIGETQGQITNKSNVKVKLKVPQGEKVLLLKNGQILMKRGQTIEFLPENVVEEKIDGRTVRVVKGHILKPFEALTKYYTGKWSQGLTEEQKESIYQYTETEEDNKESGYKNINGTLRGTVKLDNPEKVNKNINNIKSALEQAYLPQKLTVHRFVEEEAIGEKLGFLKSAFAFFEQKDELESYGNFIQKSIGLVEQKINQTFVDPAFTSTTLRKENVFLDGVTKKDHLQKYARPIRFDITLYPGAHAALLTGGITDLPKEEEVLVQAGSTYKITGASTEIVKINLDGPDEPENKMPILVIKMDLLNTPLEGK
ncbi:ADP-ribosyltransferase [Bacillus sp. 196mf]|uniref:ADP-ribosyltransferase n=1 Tax=Bacillus sp. 196mf TaxID=1761754 RepID=UPI000D7BB41A|nr:ADP-ribosyltransferase [Bacillus sp. 196mf]PYE87135.1 ADP-ribosyltransferase exoenzyme [Bacillus sp. 196mf]